MSLDPVLALASQHGRICPRPLHWSALFELLPDVRSDAYGSIPAAPLILDAWSRTSDGDKIARLREHLEWAQRHGALQRVQAFLAALPESAWHHAGES